jgi:dTMP kinase
MHIDFLENYDEESIISELKRIAQLTGKNTVTKDDIKKYGRVSYSKVQTTFGSLRQALEKADLQHTRFTKAEKQELLKILCELWEKTLNKERRRPGRKDLKKYGYSVSPDVYHSHFSSWKRALIEAYEFATEANDFFKDDIKPDIKGNLNTPQKRENLSIRKRFFVMKRDEFSCRLCGASGYGIKLEVDHILPFSKGGDDALENLQTLCFDCNRGKRDSLEKDDRQIKDSDFSGLFVTFEGIDGSGKSTQLELCAKALQAQGREVVITRNPGGTEFGQELRQILLHSKHPVGTMAELFLFMADRAQHMEELVRPVLARGGLVLCDRHMDSTIAYQGYGRGLDLEMITSLNTLATQDIQPDLTLLFNGDPRLLAQRVSARGATDRLEGEPLAFRERVHSGYQAQAEQHPARITCINALQSIEAVHQEVISIISGKLQTL